MSRSNEELAAALQRGDRDASAELLAQNQGLLTRWAGAIQARYGLSDLLDDLVQEGSIALLQAAGRFDAGRNVKLMSFAGHAVRQAMGDCAASLGTVVSMPVSRLRQIRAARNWAARAPAEWSREQAEALAAEKLGLSPSVVRALLAQGEALLTYAPLEEQKKTPSEYGDPESVYEKRLLSEHITWLVETVLTVREQTLVRHYFGLGADTAGGMTLEELALRLNYNGPSGAQKSLTTALRKLRQHFDSGQWSNWQEAKRKINRFRSDVIGLNCGK